MKKSIELHPPTYPNLPSSYLQVPRFSYSQERKKFLFSTDRKLLHGEADDKTEMFTTRYSILHQRALHHDLFTPASYAASGADKSSKFSLKPVEHLLSCSGSLGDIIVLGMLTVLKEGVYYLEDPSGVWVYYHLMVVTFSVTK